MKIRFQDSPQSQMPKSKKQASQSATQPSFKNQAQIQPQYPSQNPGNLQATPQNQANAAGTLLENRYEITGTIKQGAMGCIFKAWDTRLETIVAVKKMLSTFANPDEIAYAEQRFREEAKLLSKLHHGGLPKVIDYFITREPTTGKSAHYLIMTFMEGKDLETLILERGLPFPVNEVLNYARQIIDILIYLHAHNPPIIYRDVKPANVMIRDDQVSLVDFGIARIFTPQQKGTAIGTPGFASPEQYKGNAEPRSDIYSLGVLLHYLLTGVDPQGSSQPLFTFESPRKLNQKVPKYVDKAVVSMVDVVPDRRPASAERAKKMLESRRTIIDWLKKE